MMESQLIQLPPVRTRITNPIALQQLAEQLAIAAENVVEPIEQIKEPEPAQEPSREPHKPLVRPPHKPIHSRVWTWLILQVATPLRFKRLALWSLKLPPRAWSMLTTITSKRESPDEKADRDMVCAACPSRVYRLRRSKGDVVMDEHCGKCGCPDWKLSRNVVRNWYTAWNCPERRHAGPYPNDDLRAKLESEGYDPKVVLSVGGGCTGCGCGKAKQG